MSQCGFWEQREEQLALRVAALFEENWAIIDAMISRYAGAHLTRPHALRVAKQAIAILEKREAGKT